MFYVFVFLSLCRCCMVGVFGDDVKSVSVTEGDSVTLNTDTDIQTHDVIQWLFGSKGTPIARHKRTNNKIFTYDVDLDERFRDKLQMDHQTGSLTITNIRTQHTGLYQMIISGSSRINSYKCKVTVYARLPVPVISRNSSPNSSSCVFVCSVMNVSHVTLSWYKGTSLLSSIGVFDVNIISSISLHLECLDDSYRCVINNPIRNHTTHLITDDCQSCAGCVCCCYGLQAVIRLVVSVLVGVATVAVLLNDVRSRRVMQKRSQTPSDMTVTAL